MSKRADLLAIAIVSGILARWVSKHTFDESGNIIGRKEGFDGTGLPLDYAKLSAAYSVDRARIDRAIGYLVSRKFITTERRSGTVFCKPRIDDIQKLYDGLGLIAGNGQGDHAISPPERKQHGGPGQSIRNSANSAGQSAVSHSMISGERNDTLFGNNSNHPSGKPGKPEFAWFKSHFISKFRTSRGIDYIFKGGRDAKAISNLLKHFGIVCYTSLTQQKVNEIDHFMDFYLNEPDREYFTGGYSLHGMWDNLAALQIRVSKKPPSIKLSSRHYNPDGTPRAVVSWE